MSTRKRWTDEETTFLKENYLKYTVSQIAELVNHPLESTRDKANSLGLKHPQKIYFYNENFFEYPSVLNSYWAGFIAADGCLKLPPKSRLDLKISVKDLTHLEQFRSDISSNAKIRHYTQKVGPTSLVKNKEKNYPMVELILYSFNKTYEDLCKNYNITNAKSLTLQPPSNLDWTNSLAFIKGYIDGDGNLGLYKSSDRPKPRLSLGILGTSSMLSWIKDIFTQIYGKETGRKVNKRNNTQAYNYRCDDQKAYTIGSIICNSVNRGLDRKWSALYHAKELYNYDVRVLSYN